MPNSDEHIKKIIKNSFDGEQRKAPEGLWSDISHASNLTDAEYKIRKSYNNQEKSAPLKTWGNLKRQLIIDDVWDNIVTYQDRRKRRFIWWFTGVASVLILLISVSIFNLKSENKNNNIVEFIEDPITQGKSISYDKTDTKQSDSSMIRINNSALSHPNYSSDLSEATSTNSSIVSENNQEGMKDSNNTSGISRLYLTNNSNVSDYELEKLKDTAYNDMSLLYESKVNTEGEHKFNESLNSNISFDSSVITQIYLERVPSKGAQPIFTYITQPILKANFDTIQKEEFQRFEVGLIASLGNSWILNNDVKNGWNRNSLISNNLSKGYNIGALIEYKFNKNSGIELEYDFYSIHNQGYDFYNEGRLIHKDIRLKQQKASVDYKFRFVKNPYRRRTLLIKTGIFFSHSIKEQTSINWVENTANSSFTSFDYGLNIGAGLEQHISKFRIEYGIKSDVGLNNITANTINFPKKFNYTNTCLLAGYVSFRYLF